MPAWCRPDRGPIRREAELAVRVAEAVEEVRGRGNRAARPPSARPATSSASGQPEARSVASTISIAVMPKPRMLGAEPRSPGPADHLVVGAALARRLDQLGAELDVAVAAGLVDVVVLEEHRRGQHDVGHRGRLGHELLVHGDEQVLAQRSRAARGCCRAPPPTGLVFWISMRVHRRAVAEIAAVAGQDGADAAHVQLAQSTCRARSSPSISVLSQR